MKEQYINKINKYFKYNKKCREVFLNQVENFYKYSNIDNNNQKYKINDEVVLNSNKLLHGSKENLETLEIISKSGLISSEFFSEYKKWKKKPFVVELWDFKEQIKLKDYIKKNTGVTIDFFNNSGKIVESSTISLEEINAEIRRVKNYRDYIIYQNQEQRFLPNDYIENSSTVAFIINFSDDNDLIKNDIFDINFDKKILKKILPKWFYKKYILTRKFDHYETGREKAILFGLPVNMIEGIMLSRKYENDQEIIKKIKELFPKCYLCNIDGRVL